LRFIAFRHAPILPQEGYNRRMRRPLDYASANDEGGSKVAWAVVIAFVCLPIIAFGLLMLWYGVTGAKEMYCIPPPGADLPFSNRDDAYHRIVL